MSPYPSLDDLTDQAERNTIFDRQRVAGNVPDRMAGSDSNHRRFVQFRARMFLSPPSARLRSEAPTGNHAAFTQAVAYILILRSQPEMIGIDTERIVPRGAVVVDLEPVRDHFSVEFPGEAVSVDVLSLVAHHSITVRRRAAPEPADFSYGYMHPEAICQRLAVGVDSEASVRAVSASAAHDRVMRGKERLSAMLTSLLNSVSLMRHRRLLSVSRQGRGNGAWLSLMFRKQMFVSFVKSARVERAYGR